jgi:hypothetical protein
MSLFVFLLFVFNILGLLLAELLSELSKSSSLKSPPDDFKDAASLSSSHHWKMQKPDCSCRLQFFFSAPFVLSSVAFACRVSSLLPLWDYFFFCPSLHLIHCGVSFCRVEESVEVRGIAEFLVWQQQQRRQEGVPEL